MLRAVIDTNVLFTGLTCQGPDGSVIDAWVAKRFVPCVSTALALEYEDVLGRKLGERKRKFPLGALQALFARAEFIPIWTRVRPLSPDPGDDFIIECALNAQACLVSQNLKDLKVAEDVLRIPVLTPTQFLAHLQE